MIDKSSFRTIRAFNGSQQNGFEELICQLAHLAPPPGAKSFIRKEGSGGDAGVECYWILQDGTEHAWQAKYFLDSFGPQEWRQIEESVQTAIKKHPNLRKYYVCVPRDRTDGRAAGGGGKPKKSTQKEWTDKVQKWKGDALARGMDVDFEYWGAFEILTPLQSDNAVYSGRALYWFNKVILTKEKLKQCLQRQRESLGERYTPEFHVELPIAKVLFGLLNGDEFWRQVNDQAQRWQEEYSSLLRMEAPSALSKEFDELRSSLNNFNGSINTLVPSRSVALLTEITEVAEKLADQLSGFENKCRYSEDATKRAAHQVQSFRDAVFRFAFQKHDNLRNFLLSDYVKANNAKAILVTGEAGSGKSHLLCDFAINLLDSNSPAILLLGQHYTGENPLLNLLDHLDLRQHDYEPVLGALDSCGEAAGVRTLLMIDAINEGRHRENWRERIIGLLEDLARFPNIAVVISCRTRFEDRLIPKHVQSTKLMRLVHHGFRGHEFRAADQYLSRQGIAKPSTPIAAPEFSNPLFLKTCAAALKKRGETSWPKGHMGASKLFEIYIDSLDYTVSARRGTEYNDLLCKKALEAVAGAMFPGDLVGLPWDDARTIVSEIDAYPNKQDPLFDALLQEGALVDDFDYTSDSGGLSTERRIVRFTYERFCEQFVAQKILGGIADPTHIFEKVHPFGKAISRLSHYRFPGIMRALSIIIPERFGVEFWDILPAHIKQHPQSADHFFFESLPLRASDSFTVRTRELFNSLRPYGVDFQDKRFDILVQFAVEQHHPWNADRLHEILTRPSMPDRDACWSVYVAKNDYLENDDEYDQRPESPIRSTIEWATYADLDNLEQEQALLALTVLIWFTTTTKRKTRDQATKAAARVIAHFPENVVRLLTRFREIDDLYLQERLYASVYGGLCNAKTDDHLKASAKFVFDLQFKNNSPAVHLLLRDYARGIIELARERGCKHTSIVLRKCRPPYISDWPLENPPDKEFNKYGNKIEHSVFSDDFGHYTMSSTRNWSSTLLQEPRAKSCAEHLEESLNALTEESRDLFRTAVELAKQHEENRWKEEYATPRLDEHELDELIDSKELNESLGDGGEQLSREDIRTEVQNVLAEIQSPSGKWPSREEVDRAWMNFDSSLSTAEKERIDEVRFYWRTGHIKATVDKEWAQRWVCKQAFKLGWTKERFQKFENSLPWAGRSRPSIERIGKKYQRIAYHTLLAHLADNVHYIGDDGYTDTPKPPRYRGPWQPWVRDIDPTHWLRKTSDDGWGDWNASVWWRPLDYRFTLASDEAKRQWCEDATSLPTFENYIKVFNESQRAWYSLCGFSAWREKEVSGDTSAFIRDIWFRINSIIVTERDFSHLQNELAEKDFISPDFVSSTSTGHQIYLREYPWHQSVRVKDHFAKGEAWNIKTPHIVPYAEYEWEQGNGDDSTEMNISFYMPSNSLIQKLKLVYARTHFDRWINDSGKVAFFDPSVESDGPSFALVDCESLNRVLVEDKLIVVWLIGGEKNLILPKGRGLEARMVFNSMLWTGRDGQIYSSDRHYMENAADA